MARGTTRRRFLEATVGVGIAGGIARSGTADETGREQASGWPMFGRDAGNTGHAPNGSVPVANVREAWSVEGLPTDAAPVAVDGTVYVGGSDRRTGSDYVSALDASTGDVQWTHETGSGVSGSPAVADGAVYVSDGTGVLALDAASGSRRWAFEGFEYDAGSSPTVVDDAVYASGNDGDVYALDAATGSQQWRFDTGEAAAMTTPAVADGTVYVGSNDYSVYAVDAASGDEQWSFQTGGQVVASPAVADGTVYVASKDEGIYALDAASGESQWKFTIDNYEDQPTSGMTASPVVVGDTVVAGLRTLFGLDASTGDERWSHSLTREVAPSIAASGGTVFFATYTTMYALTGEEEPTTTTTAETTTTTTAETTTERTGDGDAGDQGGEPNYDGWFSDVSNYDGTVDRRGQTEVTVEVGVDADAAFAFAPPAVRVDPGTSVLFEWVSDNHSLEVESQPAGGGWEGHPTVENEGFSYEHTFETTGVYTYYCRPHRELGMKGAVVVGDAGLDGGSAGGGDGGSDATGGGSDGGGDGAGGGDDDAGGGGGIPVGPVALGAGGLAALVGGGVVARRMLDRDDDGGTADAGLNGDDRGDGPATEPTGGQASTGPHGDPTAPPGETIAEAEALVESCLPDGPAAAALDAAREHHDEGRTERARERARQAREIADHERVVVGTALDPNSRVDDPSLEEIRALGGQYGFEDATAAVERLVEAAAGSREAIAVAEADVADCLPEGPAAAALDAARDHHRNREFERARTRARQARDLAERELAQIESARTTGGTVDEAGLTELREQATRYDLDVDVVVAYEELADPDAVDALQGIEPPTEIPRAPDLDLEYDRIRKGEKLGSGATADVYRATASTPDGDLTVALKDPRGVEDVVVDSFEREAETWDNLDDHDNIVGVIDYGSDPHPWIAMEYMDGGTLLGVAGKLPPRRAIWTALGTVEGVYHAHTLGVAHLDLKPENVLLRSTGSDTWPVPKVADWGLAKLLIEQTRSVKGYTPLYAAPEQIDDDRFGSPDHQTDVYQLGAVVYALTTGRAPFDGETSSVVYDILESDVTPPTEYAPGMPAELDEILLRAMEKNKDDRYETVVYLRDALRDLYEGL